MIFEDKDRIVFAGDSVTDADKTQPHGDDDALGQGLESDMFALCMICLRQSIPIGISV